MITLRNGLAVGSGAPVRVNCNIGCNSEKEYASELQKIEAIKVSGSIPDMMMDLSLIRMHKPLYLDILLVISLVILAALLIVFSQPLPLHEMLITLANG